MIANEAACLFELRALLKLAGHEDSAALSAFHALVDKRGCTAVRRALTKLEREHATPSSYEASRS